MAAEPILSGRMLQPASRVLGQKLDSIPFSPYHVLIITCWAWSALPTATIWS